MLKMQTDKSLNVRSLISSSMKAMRESDECTDSWKTDPLGHSTREQTHQQDAKKVIEPQMKEVVRRISNDERAQSLRDVDVKSL
jgi:hypothetical protein